MAGRGILSGTTLSRGHSAHPLRPPTPRAPPGHRLTQLRPRDSQRRSLPSRPPEPDDGPPSRPTLCPVPTSMPLPGPLAKRVPARPPEVLTCPQEGASLGPLPAPLLGTQAGLLSDGALRPDVHLGAPVTAAPWEPSRSRPEVGRDPSTLPCSPQRSPRQTHALCLSISPKMQRAGSVPGPESGSLGLTAPRPGPSRDAEGTPGGQRDACPQQLGPQEPTPAPGCPSWPACRHPGVWMPTLCGWGLGAKGWAESAPPFVPLRERGTEWDQFRFPGPCVVFRSVSASRAVL